MIQTFLSRAKQDEPVYITDVRRSFQAKGTRPFHLHLTQYDGVVRSFPLTLPTWAGEEEAAFVRSYLYATVYNILSALGGVEMEVYLDPADQELVELATDLNNIFQTSIPKEARRGYGKCLNVNERVLKSLAISKKEFSFTVKTLYQEESVPPLKAIEGTPVFAALPNVAADKILLGIDIGGTDIKLCSGCRGRLAVCKEFDWDPASYREAAQLTGPVLLLARLIRAATSLYALGRENEIKSWALTREATLDDMERGAAEMEAAAESKLLAFDAIGISFPDVVIQNRIVGGETPKTQGMRENKALDYENQFAQVSRLPDALKAYTKDGVVLCVNDGPTAAFTAATELTAGEEQISCGFFAHSLGTDLGSGWVLPDGSVPDIPLEAYNFVIDLGSYGQRNLPIRDVRSVRSTNTGLSGGAQKYTGQAGAFRLAAQWLPEREPETFQDALARGFFVREGGDLRVPTAPQDMRKPFLEHLMGKAAQAGHPACQDIFRAVGEALAVTWAETQDILSPKAVERTLFGRLVKEQACFNLIVEGATQREPALILHRADEDLANTPMMKQLARHTDYTVAQFAQAVGAMYLGCVGLLPQPGEIC